MRVLCLVLSLCLSLYTSSSSLLNGGLDSSIQESREYTRALLLKKRVKTPPLPTKKDTLFFYNDDDLSERVEEKRLPPLTRKKKKKKKKTRRVSFSFFLPVFYRQEDIFGFGLTALCESCDLKIEKEKKEKKKEKNITTDNTQRSLSLRQSVDDDEL